MDNAVITAILEKVKANQDKLDACKKPHDFQPTGTLKLFDRFRCTKCGGEVEMAERNWYVRGLKDANVSK